MKVELFKREDRYDLYGVDGAKIASSDPNPFGKLSKENCDEIFGVVDVEKLAKDEAIKISESEIRDEKLERIYKRGFNKAMELNKDKLFTVEDVKHAMNRVWSWMSIEEDKDCSVLSELEEKVIHSLQQPTEIEVEIAVLLTERDGGVVIETPKLDADGCLILKNK